jgi:membrane protein
VAGAAVVVITMFAVLFYAARNVKLAGFKWVSPGALFAVVVWLIRLGAVRVLRRELELL